mgnify:CR=1 FL=1
MKEEKEAKDQNVKSEKDIKTQVEELTRELMEIVGFGHNQEVSNEGQQRRIEEIKM